MLRGGDSVPEHGPVGGQELDDVGGQATVPQHFVDGVAGRHSGVAGLPQNHVTLRDTAESSQSNRTGSEHRAAALIGPCEEIKRWSNPEKCSDLMFQIGSHDPTVGLHDYDQNDNH